MIRNYSMARGSPLAKTRSGDRYLRPALAPSTGGCYALQHDARLSTAELARRLDLSARASERMRKLSSRGIRGYVTVVDREAVGLDLLCFIHAPWRITAGLVKRFTDKIRKSGSARVPLSYRRVATC